MELSNFYPRPPRGGRHLATLDTLTTAADISIHALREEGDGHPVAGLAVIGFISIHALREEGDLAISHNCYLFTFISIHALREEGDGFLLFITIVALNFYPRPPRGGRPAYRVQTSNV